MELKCKRPDCLHEWEYKGTSKFYASCPKCKSSIRVRDTEKEQKQ